MGYREAERMNSPETCTKNFFERLMLLIINEHMYQNELIDKDTREKMENKIAMM